jgi:hypothetical protein
MDKKKIEFIATGVLIVVFIFVLANAFKPKKPKPKPTPEAVKEEKRIPVPSVEETKPLPSTVSPKLISLQKERAKLDWGRDPFSRVMREEVYSGTSLILKGVSLGRDGVGYAFINDEVVTVGDTIAGYQVIEVEKNKVLLRKEEESFYLVLPEE